MRLRRFFRVKDSSEIEKFELVSYYLNDVAGIWYKLCEEIRGDVVVLTN